jgi:hypothetical protein
VKKKPFINKKAAQHFHVVHRSQRDPLANDPNASKFVLLSSSSDIVSKLFVHSLYWELFLLYVYVTIP